MSTFYADRLFNDAPLEKGIRITESITISKLRPYIYLENGLLDGDLVIEVYEGSDLLGSSTLSNTQVNAILGTDTYAHGYIRFDFDGLVLNHNQENSFTQYTIRTLLTNHTNSDTNSIYLVSDFNNIYELYDAGLTHYGHELYIF